MRNERFLYAERDVQCVLWAQRQLSINKNYLIPWKPSRYRRYCKKNGLHTGDAARSTVKMQKEVERREKVEKTKSE